MFGGLVRVNGHPAAKPAQLVKEADAIDCDTRSLLYVGRGGYKLQKALDVTGWRLEGVTAMDIGASTRRFYRLHAAARGRESLRCGRGP